MDGRVGIVTGGGSGIGMAIATELAQLGCRVVIASRNEEKLSAAAKQINASLGGSGDLVLARRCNIRDEVEVRSLLSWCRSHLGRVHYLVNNGGGQFPAAAEAIRSKGWNAVIDTNLTGTFFCCQAAFVEGGMRENGGVIVNMIANHFNGFPGMIHTGAARAGVDAVTKTLATEWAEFGVRVNAVAPGVIYSTTAEGNYANEAKHGQNAFENHLTSNAPKIPFRRLGSVEEVSSVVTFLLSDAAAYVSGSTYRVDGALSLSQPTWDIKPTVRPVREAFPVFGNLPEVAVAPQNITGKFDDGPYPQREIDKMNMYRGLPSTPSPIAGKAKL